jgi:peptidoglycan hydrolase-like protein with peptidoglycan-binding domain
MQYKRIAVAVAIAVVAVLVAPSAASAQDAVAMPSAGWHGRAIEDPQPRPELGRTAWPVGWDAGAVARGAGYSSPEGSRRVRDLQRRLTRLGYRPGPVDGRFGPRTEAATRWFQYKHGLDLTGRVDRTTMAVLDARTTGRELAPREEPSGGQGTRAEQPPEQTPPPIDPVPVDTVAADTGGVDPALIVLAALLALAAGMLVGSFGPELLRRRQEEPETAPEPVPRPVVVYGYVTVDAPLHVDTAVAALAALATRRGWSLEKIVHDREPISGSLSDRPALVYALREIRAGAAEGLIVARVRDLTTRFGDLVALVEWMTEAGAFVASADRELDTSTGTGLATANAIVELGTWERRPGTPRPRHDRATGRFRSSDHELGRRLAAMRDRGIPLRAIADALNLARIPNPSGHTHWRPANVQAVTREETEPRS